MTKARIKLEELNTPNHIYMITKRDQLLIERVLLLEIEEIEG